MTVAHTAHEAGWLPIGQARVVDGAAVCLWALERYHDRSVPRELITVSRVYGASRGQIIREIYLPAMAPILLESARLAMVFNITAVLLCEIYGARDGIGLFTFRRPVSPWVAGL